jgi:hypothetical protein
VNEGPSSRPPYEADGAKDPQVLRHRRLGDLQPAGQGVDAQRAGAAAIRRCSRLSPGSQQLDQSQARRIGERLEEGDHLVRVLRFACHLSVVQSVSGLMGVDHLGAGEEVVQAATVLAEDEQSIDPGQDHVDHRDLLQDHDQPVAYQNARGETRR